MFLSPQDQRVAYLVVRSACLSLFSLVAAWAYRLVWAFSLPEGTGRIPAGGFDGAAVFQEDAR